MYGLGCLFFYKFYYIIYIAVKGVAKGIQRFGAYCFAFFHTMKGVGGKSLLKDQVIFGYSLFEKRFIKRLVGNHLHHHKNFIILNLLTILNILSIITSNIYLAVFTNS